MSGRRSDAGSATVWVLAFAALVCAMTGVAVLRTAAVLARHRAETAADLAALAAAGAIGTAAPPCAAAASLARADGARAIRCTVALDASTRSGTVLVQVARDVSVPLVGARSVTATARAARLPTVHSAP